MLNKMKMKFRGTNNSGKTISCGEDLKLYGKQVDADRCNDRVVFVMYDSIK